MLSLKLQDGRLLHPRGATIPADRREGDNRYIRYEIGTTHLCPMLSRARRVSRCLSFCFSNHLTPSLGQGRPRGTRRLHVQAGSGPFHNLITLGGLGDESVPLDSAACHVVAEVCFSPRWFNPFPSPGIWPRAADPSVQHAKPTGLAIGHARHRGACRVDIDLI